MQNAVDTCPFAGSLQQDVARNCRDKSSTLHFIGLFSDGNVHSHIEHPKAMITKAKAEGIAKVAIRALLDGVTSVKRHPRPHYRPFEAWLAEVELNYGIGLGSQEHHHGPLRSRLVDGRARPGDACPR